jgi:F0F1-type ATP synthase assembly protein I
MAMEPDHSTRKPKPSNNYIRYSSLGLQLVALIAVAGWLGYLLDGYLELKVPVFLILFVVAAFGGFIYNLYRSFNKPE